MLHVASQLMTVHKVQCCNAAGLDMFYISVLTCTIYHKCLWSFHMYICSSTQSSNCHFARCMLYALKEQCFETTGCIAVYLLTVLTPWLQVCAGNRHCIVIVYCRNIFCCKWIAHVMSQTLTVGVLSSLHAAVSCHFSCFMYMSINRDKMTSHWNHALSLLSLRSLSAKCSHDGNVIPYVSIIKLMSL